MRLALGVAVGGLIFLFGLMAFAGSMDLMSRQGGVEKVWVGFGLGSLLMALGITIIAIAVKAARQRKAARRAKAKGQHAPGKPVDRGELEGTLFGIGMATLGDDNLDGGSDD